MEKLTKEQKTRMLKAFMARTFPTLDEEKKEELEALRESPEYKAKVQEMAGISEEELMDMFMATVNSLEQRKMDGKTSEIEVKSVEKALSILADNILQGNFKKDRLHVASIDKA